MQPASGVRHHLPKCSINNRSSEFNVDEFARCILLRDVGLTLAPPRLTRSWSCWDETIKTWLPWNGVISSMNRGAACRRSWWRQVSLIMWEHRPSLVSNFSKVGAINESQRFVLMMWSGRSARTSRCSRFLHPSKWRWNALGCWDAVAVCYGVNSHGNEKRRGWGWHFCRAIRLSGFSNAFDYGVSADVEQKTRDETKATVARWRPMAAIRHILWQPTWEIASSSWGGGRVNWITWPNPLTPKRMRATGDAVAAGESGDEGAISRLHHWIRRPKKNQSRHPMRRENGGLNGIGRTAPSWH